MENVLLTAYMLVFPLVAGIVLLVIAVAFGKEWAQARREGRDII
ncbi:MAG: putative transporter small subunit [Nocardioides sp.]|nr:putative transporter small subunit [Nocardioides sp.]